MATPLWAMASVLLSAWTVQSQVTIGATLGATSCFDSHSIWITPVSWLSQMARFAHGGLKNYTAAQDDLELGTLSFWSAGTRGMCHLIKETLDSLKCLSHSCLVDPGHEVRVDGSWPWCRTRSPLLLFLAGWAG